MYRADLPRHNAPALSLVRTALKQLPTAKNIAFFDTAFHTLSLPEHIRTYPLDPDHARRHKIRRYGFHGISYAFIVREVAAYLNKVSSTHHQQKSNQPKLN